MKNLFLKLKKMLGATLETAAHPDLKAPSDWGVPQPECLPRTSPTGTGAESDAPRGALAVSTDNELHPDFQIFAEDLPDNPRTEPPIWADMPVSGHQPRSADAVTESEAENEGSARQKPDPDIAPTSPAPDVANLSDQIDAAEVDGEYDTLAEEEDELAEQDDEFWEAALSHEVGEEAEGDADVSFDVADFGEIPELDPQEIENETESAQWEELLDLDLHEEDRSPPDAVVEEETITDDRQLDDYAARLVIQMQILSLDERARLQRRFKAILEEFPFSASYKALSRLVKAGASLEELEDACEIKCLWREAPWLWLHRRFNRIQRAWVVEAHASCRSALSWKLALKLIRQVGLPEAERRIVGDWLSEWLQLQPEQMSEIIKDPRFWSYPAYLQLNHESIPLIDEEYWYYEEPVDIRPWSSFRLEGEGGQIWCFEPKNNHRDTGALSRLPHSKRIAEQEKAKAKQVNKDA